jgi:hypothetical protein
VIALGFAIWESEKKCISRKGAKPPGKNFVKVRNTVQKNAGKPDNFNSDYRLCQDDL